MLQIFTCKDPQNINKMGLLRGTQVKKRKIGKTSANIHGFKKN